MQPLLRFSRFIDFLNEKVGHSVLWLVLAATLISTANALVRKFFNYSSNAYLEIQWYLFSAFFLLAAGYTLLRNEHVRIDVFLHRFSKRTQIKVDIFGLIVFLLPAMALTIYLSWPFFLQGLETGEMSENAGGLIRWPVYLLIPIGLAFLWIQGISEIIKRVAYLKGLIEDPTKRAQEKTAEEELAEAIRAEAEKAEAEKASAQQGERK